MPQPIDASKLVQRINDTPIIDVRSPIEYEKGHIPNAQNLPLFSNEEREKVGIKYKQGGRETAIELGLKFVGPRLTDYIKQARKIAPDKNIIVHCWRGGMRSANMAWLLELAGFNVKILNGGYNAYRKLIRWQFTQAKNLVVLSGFTGSGKTDILHELNNLGEQIIDLEGLAHHKGSAFGGIGQPKQPTSEQFENDLAYQWNRLDLAKRIWIEDESITIGVDGIPQTLFQLMKDTAVYKVNVPKMEREKRLVREYAYLDKDLLKDSIIRISDRLGGLAVKEALEALAQDNYLKVADLTLVYYDKAYLKGLEKRIKDTITEVNVAVDDPKQTALILLSIVK